MFFFISRLIMCVFMATCSLISHVVLFMASRMLMSVLICFLSFSLLTFAAIDLAALATNAMSSVKASVRKLDFGSLIIVPVRRLLLLAIFCYAFWFCPSCLCSLAQVLLVASSTI